MTGRHRRAGQRGGWALLPLAVLRLLMAHKGLRKAPRGGEVFTVGPEHPRPAAPVSVAPTAVPAYIIPAQRERVNELV